jgi:two-component system, LytTR family, response regulator
MLSTLLIDDEPLAISRLKRLLLQFPADLEVIGSANDGKTALNMIAELQPDLIFLDIEMPEMSGFELLTQLPEVPLIVFCTAYDQYAIRAFEENSIDYLLKPVEMERLEKTVEKIRKLTTKPQQNPFNTDLMALLETLKPKKDIHAISVKVGDRILFTPLSEIAYFEAEDKYVYLFTIAGRKYLCNYTIAALETKLPEAFIRVSRAAIVHTLVIKELQKEFNGNFVILLNDFSHSKIKTGAAYLEQLKKLMEL